jgi:hypothetical protein
MAATASITVSSAGAAIKAAVANAIQSNILHGIVVSVAGGLGIVAAGGLTAEIAGAIIPTVPGGINDGGITGGIGTTVPSGIVSNPSSGNGILLAGSTEWIGYSTRRTITRRFPFGIGSSGMSLGTGWTDGAFGLGPGITGAATSNNYILPLKGLFDGHFNAALLSGASLEFFVGQSHSSTPAAFPSVTIYRSTTGTSSGPGSTLNLFTGSPTAGSGALWFASGAQQSFPIPIVGSPTQSDPETYLYTLILQDENGSGSLSGNGYVSLTLTFSNIANSAPG